MGQVLGDLAAALLAVLVLSAIAAGSMVVGALWVRRAWRRKRVELALRFNGLAIGAAAAGARWLWTRPLPDHRWRTLQRARRHLLQASSGAELAVREAVAADASVGDLQGLTRRLRQATQDLDRSLRIAQQSGSEDPLGELLRHASELTKAARGITRSAAASLADLHRDTTDELVRHVRFEEHASLHGTTR